MQEVKPTWKLAWGLWWRMMLITLGIYAVVAIIALIVGAAAILPFLGSL
jgi:hypothetical protein